MKFLTLGCMLAATATASVAGVRQLEARQSAPNLPTEPGTTTHCNLWWDNEGFLPCDSVVSIFGLSMADFLRWNPTITPQCGNFKTGFSYCVGASEPPPTPTTSRPNTVTTTTPPVVTTPPTTTRVTTTTTTSTSPGNGIQTPLPIQLGMTTSCNKFHFVKAGEQCDGLVSSYGLTLSQFTSWNPAVGGSSCSTLWAETWACVGIIGFTPITTTTTTTRPVTTTTGAPTPIRVVQTPSPIQPNMVRNCYRFYKVKSGDTCVTISSAIGVTVSQLVQWNPAVGSSCTSMWAENYLCVAVRSAAIPTHYHHGCYAEPNPDRALTLAIAPASTRNSMNVEACAVFCMAERGASIFGIQNGGDCRCGNAVNAGSLRVADSQCNRPCTGNEAQACGAPWIYNMYSSSPTPPITYKHHGCATVSGTSGRIFGAASTSSSSMTVAFCADFCLGERKTSKFAVLNGRDCVCGNTPRSDSSWRPESECNMPCAGNSNAAERCGASNRGNVYSNENARPVMG